MAESPSPLADAAERADSETVRALLEEGADVNAAQIDGMTALHWAVYRGDLETTKQLLEAGAKPDAKNRYDVRPLALACENGNGEIVAALLARGADANARRRSGETPLLAAARTGKIEPVKALLDAGAKVNETERRGQTALMWAAAEGHAKVVRLLIENGAKAGVRLRSGFTAFLFAVREGRTSVVRALLDAGVDVNEALAPGRPSGSGAWKKAGARETSALLLAVENAHFELALELLRAGADPNDERSGLTALHTIPRTRKAERGDGEGGNPPPEGSGKVTSLEFVRALVEHGADVNRRLERGRSGACVLNLKGATPFLLAAKSADVPLMKVLLELGADPKIPNAENCTPLLAAAGMGVRAPGEERGTEVEALSALRLLLELGADVNAVDANGETAMHCAAYKNAPKIVAFLAERGAKIDVWNQKNKHGWTPLVIAEGFRPGNYKPSRVTVAAIHRVMRSAGITPPPPRPRRPKEKRGDY